MKRISMVMALAIVLAIASTQFSYAADQDFQLHNRTGVDIHSIYCAPSASESWESDLLDGKVLQNGAEIGIRFHPNETAAHWDLKVEDINGNYLYWRNLDLTSISDIILENDGTARLK